MRNKIYDFVFGLEDPLQLAQFRIWVSVTLFIYITERATHPLEWLTSWGFHYSTAAHDYWFPPPPPLLPESLVVPFLLCFLATIVVVILRPSRLATAGVLGAVLYVTFADPPSSFTLNRIYIVIYSILVLAPSPRRISGPNGPRLLQSVWPVRVLQATLVIQYFSAGYCKVVHGNWLEDPLVVWSQSQGHFMNDLSYWLLANAPLFFWTVLQYASLSFELLAPLLFLTRRLRPIGILWGIGFHLGIALTMHKLIYFSLQMMCFYILFLEPNLLKRIDTHLRDWCTRLGRALHSKLRPVESPD